MDNNYKTFWFSEQELKNLWSALQEVKDVTPEQKKTLRSVYDEIAVVFVRAKWFTPDLGRIAVSLGHDDTALPLRFSEEDIRTLSSLPLASNVKEVLS